jgi:hypothetical protein
MVVLVETDSQLILLALPLYMRPGVVVVDLMCLHLEWVVVMALVVQGNRLHTLPQQVHPIQALVAAGLGTLVDQMVSLAQARTAW